MKTLQNQQEPTPPDPICLQNASLNALQKLRPWMQEDMGQCPGQQDGSQESTDEHLDVTNCDDDVTVDVN